MQTRNDIPSIEKEDLLLKQFNNRKGVAIGEVYSLYYDELNRFASRLYQNTEVISSDVIHDIFIQIWQANKVKFESLSDIKSYVYVCIRNRFRNYLVHEKSKAKYRDTRILEDDYFTIGVAENEIFSIINQALDILPEDCVEVVSRLIDGWSIKDIAEELGRPKRTIYNKRDEAISILKQKMTKNKLLILLITMP